jgi:hypothetical protein
MKRTSLLILLLTLGFFAFSQQTGDTLSLITGKWRFQSIDDRIYKELDSAEKENFKKAIVIFAGNKSYTSFLGDSIVETGTWKYLPGERKIVCKTAGNKSTTILLLSINKDEIKAQSIEEGEGEKMSVVLKAVK